MTASSSTTTATPSSATTSTTPAQWRSCPMNDAGEVLLIKQYRHPVGMDLWEIPAGLLDVEGEDFVAGAARELAEEADLVAGQLERAGRFLQFARLLQRGHPDLPRPRTSPRCPATNATSARTRKRRSNSTGSPWTTPWPAVLEGRLHNPSAVVGILAAAAARADGFARASARPMRPGPRIPASADDGGHRGRSRRTPVPDEPAKPPAPDRDRPRHHRLPAAHGR